jgi:hypothetical protein
VVGGSGKGRLAARHVSEIPEMPARTTLTLRRLHKLAAFFGAQAVLTGDGAFDAAFAVKGEAPDQVRAWFDEGRRSALLRTLAAVPDMEIAEGSLRWEQGKVVVKPEPLAKGLEGLRSLAPSLKPER